LVPTAYVFVEFGDNFPATGLTTTVGAVRDVATAQLSNHVVPIPNTVIPGPQLADANDNNYGDATAVNFTRFMNTAVQRAQMMAAAREAFASFFLSPLIVTVNVLLVWPGANVKVPDVAT